MTARDAEGTEIKVGDIVEFKADIEQVGKVVKIDSYGGLVIENENGFIGEYIGGDTRTTENADRVFKCA
mgnify:CR=1 FL=1